MKERERREEEWGVEFWEISSKEEDEKRGFGHSGITPRRGEWETGMQKDIERGDTKTAVLLFDLQTRKKIKRQSTSCLLQFRVMYYLKNGNVLGTQASCPIFFPQIEASYETILEMHIHCQSISLIQPANFLVKTSLSPSGKTHRQ